MSKENMKAYWKENLKYFIENEMYEECQKITDAITALNVD